MTTSLDSQFFIRSTVFGRGTNDLWFDKARVTGLLGVPQPKTSDVDLWGQPGAEGNPEYAGVRLLTITAKIVSASQAAALTAIAALDTAWASSNTDIPLVIQLGGTRYQVSGRPRGFTDDLSEFDIYIIHVLLRFDALNPARTTV
jgi:hypothetical protein